jgi:hypothetical protein
MSGPGLTSKAKKRTPGGVFKHAWLLVIWCVLLLLAATALVRVSTAETFYDAASDRSLIHSDQPQSSARPSPTPKPARTSPTPERPAPFFDMLGAPFKGRKLVRVESPMLGLAASASVVESCNSSPRPALVRLTASGFDPEGRRLHYRWAVNGGRLGGGGNEVTWELSGVAAGAYTASVILESYSGEVLALKEARVAVRACLQPRRVAVCPSISLCCRASVKAGSHAAFVATLEGGTPGITPIIKWTVSAGRLITRLAAPPTIELDTTGLAGQTVLATAEAEGYGLGLKCLSTCATTVTLPTTPPQPGPTGMPPIHNLTPPTPPSHDSVIIEPEPSQSPSPSLTPTPTPVATHFPARLTPAKIRELGWFMKYLPWLALLAAMSTAGYLGFSGKEESPLPDGDDKSTTTTTPPVIAPDSAALAANESGDEVHCTVFAPPHAAPGDGFLVQAFAHLFEQREQLLDIANDCDEDTRQVNTKKLATRIERGRELTFFLKMPDLEVDEPKQSLVWDGEINSVQFGVNVPETFKPKSIFGTLTVSYQSVPIGHVKFMFKIVAPAAAQQAEEKPVAPPAPAPPSQSFVRYRQAFISYASEDRAEVLKRVQMLKTVNINFFHDLLSLEPGERWEQSLYKHIDDSDVIFLFWSTAAKRSQWVEREVQYALQRRRGNDVAPPEIIPVILEGPPIVTPPEYLQQLHFNDTFVYFIKAEEAIKHPPAQG